MKKYKVKPPVIEAIQWTGDNIKDIEKEFPVLLFTPEVIILHPDDLQIHVTLGQYIVRQIPGIYLEVMEESLFNSTFDVG